jgi:hypothetical protein
VIESGKSYAILNTVIEDGLGQQRHSITSLFGLV